MTNNNELVTKLKEMNSLRNKSVLFNILSLFLEILFATFIILLILKSKDVYLVLSLLTAVPFALSISLMIYYVIESKKKIKEIMQIASKM
jgi:predicted neutral ceramidase superfamily lipid hydrolase